MVFDVILSFLINISIGSRGIIHLLFLVSFLAVFEPFTFLPLTINSGAESLDFLVLGASTSVSATFLASN